MVHVNSVDPKLAEGLDSGNSESKRYHFPLRSSRPELHGLNDDYDRLIPGEISGPALAYSTNVPGS